MRKRAYCLIVLSALVLGALTVPSHARNTASAAQRRATTEALDPELRNYQYPYPVRFFEADTQGQKLRMAYMDVAAARSNGCTVVLLHGKNFSGAYWAPTIKALVAEGYRVVAPDQIGFGGAGANSRDRARECLTLLDLTRRVRLPTYAARSP